MLQTEGKAQLAFLLKYIRERMDQQRSFDRIHSPIFLFSQQRSGVVTLQFAFQSNYVGYVVEVVLHRILLLSGQKAKHGRTITNP